MLSYIIIYQSKGGKLHILYTHTIKTCCINTVNCNQDKTKTVIPSFLVLIEGRTNQAYHMAGIAWERSVDPLPMNVIGLSSGACINLLLAFFLQSFSQPVLAKHQRGNNMHGVRARAAPVLLSWVFQCQDNSLPWLHVTHLLDFLEHRSFSVSQEEDERRGVLSL